MTNEITRLAKERDKLAKAYSASLNRVIAAREKLAEAKQAIADFDAEHPHIMMLVNKARNDEKRAALGSSGKRHKAKGDVSLPSATAEGR